MTWFKVEVEDGEHRWYQALDKGKLNRFNSPEEARAFMIDSGLSSLVPCRVVKVTEEVV